MPTNEQVDILESLGWYQEHYKYMAEWLFEWNDKYWRHQWRLIDDLCLLCQSEGTCIQAGGQSLCLKCLSEYPEVPWHPTGSVRPKVTASLSHLRTCTSHS